MGIVVKTCGLSTPQNVQTAVQNNADMIGFVFFERSPRYVSFDTARTLAAQVSETIMRVGLVVDPSDAELSALLTSVPLDMLQLHGKETAHRVSAIKKAFGLPVMKALPIASATDLARASDYREVADRFLFDAKPPEGSDRPGGNAVSFDWSLMRGYTHEIPWLLAGGLDPDNVAMAVSISGARGVDISSGIESAPGVKDDDLMRSFIRTVQQIQ